MYLIKVLKRKDAASVVVAVVLAFILSSVLTVLTQDLATYLSGIEAANVASWRQLVVQPIIAALLQIILLEAFLRAIIYVRPIFVQKKK